MDGPAQSALSKIFSCRSLPVRFRPFRDTTRPVTIDLRPTHQPMSGRHFARVTWLQRPELQSRSSMVQSPAPTGTHRTPNHTGKALVAPQSAESHCAAATLKLSTSATIHWCFHLGYRRKRCKYPPLQPSSAALIWVTAADAQTWNDTFSRYAEGRQVANWRQASSRWAQQLFSHPPVTANVAVRSRCRKARQHEASSSSRRAELGEEARARKKKVRFDGQLAQRL